MNRPQSGQVVIEYVLLLVIAASLAALIVRQLASRGDDPGVLVRKWSQIQSEIGKDLPDKCQGPGCQ